MGNIITISLNPTLQKTLIFPALFPDAVNRCTEQRLDVAGKGLNVSRVLSQLGKKNTYLTPLGGRFRSVYLDLCAEDGIPIKWVDSDRDIRFCYTVINEEKRQITELVEEGEQAEEDTEKRLLSVFEDLLPESSMLIVCGSKAAGFSDAIIPELVKRAKQAGLFVILDIRGKDLLNSLPFRPDLIKPNIKEFAATFLGGQSWSLAETVDKDSAASLCYEIWEQYGCSIVLTRGSQNVWYAESGELLADKLLAGELDEFPVEHVEPLNSTGSGDAFTAGLASAIADGFSLREAVAEGVRYGRLNALLLKPGTIT